MSYRHLAFLATCLVTATPLTRAQDSLATHVTYDLTTEVAVGSGDYTAYQLVTNRHHVLATRPNTGYLRGAITISHALGHDFTLSGAVDALASVHADHKAYLQQCYVNLGWKHFFLEAGTREQQQVIRHNLLSTGAFVKGTNAKPIPQVHVGTKDFWTVPYTKDWLQIHFDFGYGKLLDNGYRENTFQSSGLVTTSYATGAYYHQKHLYLRSNPTKRFFVTVGIEHGALFGGINHEYVNGVLVSEKQKPANLKAFMKVILPIGDSNYYADDALEDWVYGNHLGSMTYQLGWNINEHHQLQAYLDNPFEDGSGIRKGNGWDGLWGMEYANKTPGRQYVRGAVIEYLQTTNQSGPLHWDGGDWPEPLRSQLNTTVVGDDDYYNHMFYGGFAHYGMVPGNALLVSPIYNKDGSQRFADNRVRAWHAAIHGDITDRLSYLFKASYREGWGTYKAPLATRHHSFDALLQGQYLLGPWQFSAAYAFDRGNIYGDCNTFNIKIGYHGKIL